MSPDWARQLAKQKKQELERKRLQAEKDLHETKLLDAHAEKMWVDVRKGISKYVEEYNRAMGSEEIQVVEIKPNNIELRAYGHSYSINFSPERWTLMAYSTMYEMKPVKGTKVIWRNSRGYEVSSDFLAQTEVTRAVNAKPRG